MTSRTHQPSADSATLDVIARNVAAGDAGSIHDDETARAHGYRGGLVTGVTLIGYATRALVERHGAAWLTGGTLDVRFVRPVYDGEPLRVALAPGRDGVAVALTTGAGTLCAEGAASCDAGGAGAAPWRTMIPVAPPARAGALPPLRYDDLVVGEELRPLYLRPSLEDLAAWADQLEDALPWYREGSPWGGAVVHPSWFARLPILLWRNTFGNKTTVHAETRLRYLAPARADKQFITHGYVAAKYERKGQGYMVLDTLTIDEDGREIARNRHTSVIRLRSEP